jgi:thioesterase domain-containing protein
VNRGGELLVPLGTASVGDPLYCVHPVSGSAYVYLGLARLLSGSRPVVGIEAPGFGTDRPPVASVSELSAEYLNALPASSAAHLLGWSMGGVIAFDMASRRIASGADVASLILIDTPVPAAATLPSERAMLERFLHEMFGPAGMLETGLAELLSDFPDPVEADGLFAAIDRMNLLPEEFDDNLLCRRYSTFRANVVAMVGYRISGGYPGPVLHIRAAEPTSGDMDWVPFATNVTCHTVAGNHFTMWTGDSLVEIGRIVRDYLGASNVV